MITKNHEYLLYFWVVVSILDLSDKKINIFSPLIYITFSFKMLSY